MQSVETADAPHLIRVQIAARCSEIAKNNTKKESTGPTVHKNIRLFYYISHITFILHKIVANTNKIAKKHEKTLRITKINKKTEKKSAATNLHRI